MSEVQPGSPDQQSFDRQIIESKNACIGVNPDGAYVSSWKVKNPQGQLVDVLYQGKTLRRTGVPLLFPNFGPATGMRQHGFGRIQSGS